MVVLHSPAEASLQSSAANPIRRLVALLQKMEDEATKEGADAAESYERFSRYCEVNMGHQRARILSAKKGIDSLTSQLKGDLSRRRASSDEAKEKMTRKSSLEVSIDGLVKTLDDAKVSLSVDERFQLELASNCDKKAREWELTKKTRAAESSALAETIRELKADGALELFQQRMSNASRTSQATVRQRALHAISALSKENSNWTELNILSLALRGKKVGFSKIVIMIDEMMAKLLTDQKDEDKKKQYCEAQLDVADNKHQKTLENAISDWSVAIAELQGTIQELTEDIPALEAGLEARNRAEAEAVKIRKQEHFEYEKLLYSDASAKEVLQRAKDRLNKVYDSKMSAPPPERETHKEERITVNRSIGVASFAEVSRHDLRKAAPPPPTETFGAHGKKTDMGHGAIVMLDILIRDLDTEMTEVDSEEKDSQAEYEKMTAVAANEQAADWRALKETISYKRSTEEVLQREQDSKAGSRRDLAGILKYIQVQHEECDELLQYYGAQAQERAGEIESLRNAKGAILSAGGASKAGV